MNSPTNLTTGSDIDGGSTSTTASVSPTTNNLLLLSIASRTAITTDPTQPTATGNGLTWVAVNSVVYDNTSSSRRRVTLLRAMGASPTGGTIAIDFGGQAQTAVNWILDQFSGVDTSGTDGSGAVVQSATNSDGTGTIASITATLAAFGSTNNAAYGAFGNGDGTQTTTPGSGFSQVAEVADGINGIKLTTEFQNANDTSVDFSYSGVTELGGVAVEIKASTARTNLPENTLRYFTVGNGMSRSEGAT